jgi:hypothetical protein
MFERSRAVDEQSVEQRTPAETSLANTDLGRVEEGVRMKEYKILREVENARLGPNNHQLLEDKVNELAREGWVVSSFGVTHAPPAFGPMGSSSAWFCALLERETKTGSAR